MCLSEGERGMALEAVVYPQTQDPFGYGVKDFYNCNWVGFEEDLNFVKEEEQGIGSTRFLENQTENNYYPYGDWNSNSSTATTTSMLTPHLIELQETTDPQNFDDSSASNTNTSRPKRRRARSRKNKEEIENQRMTHIAVERNRRKQMNEYLSVLRSLMPDSYIQRGDQASIIGGAINFVKELEHRLHFLGAKREEEEGKTDAAAGGANNNNPFSDFFSFPQYSTSAGGGGGCENSAAAAAGIGIVGEQVGEVHSGIADIEVTMVESHANLKIRSKKRPKQLLKMVSGLHNMRLTILHLNVTTTAEIVLYSLSVKVEDDCKLGSVDDVAAAVYQMLNRIQQEAMMN